MVDLAIIMAVHNRNDLRLKNSLRTLLYQETTYSYEIYIVDYASDDNLRSMLQELNSDKILYLFTDKDIGKHRAINIAIKAATNADTICVIEEHVIVPMQTVESICTATHEDTLFVYLRRPYFIPECVWQDPSMTPADYERFRVMPTEELAQTMQIGIGPSKKSLFAVKRQRVIEIGGYDELLTSRSSTSTDEDVGIVRRLLQHGCVMTDMSELIDIAYQPLAEDWAAQASLGVLEHRDIRVVEASAALFRNDPIRNVGIEWGQI
jgi:hypothetical protein